MKGNFKDLKPGSAKRNKFWNQHKQDIFDLLTEIKKDVFDDSGRIEENGDIYGADKMPPFTEPNYVYYRKTTTSGSGTRKGSTSVVSMTSIMPSSPPYHRA